MLELYNFQEAKLLRPGSLDSWGEPSSGLEVPAAVLFMPKIEALNNMFGKQEISKGYFYSQVMPRYTDKMVMTGAASAPGTIALVIKDFPSDIVDLGSPSSIDDLDVAKWYTQAPTYWTASGASAEYNYESCGILIKHLSPTLRIRKVKFTTDIMLKFNVTIGLAGGVLEPFTNQYTKMDASARYEHIFNFPSVDSNVLQLAEQGLTNPFPFEISAVEITYEIPSVLNTEYRILLIETLQGFETYGYKSYVA